MAITTSISKGYSIKLIGAAVLCAVFGVWGIYDYVYAIPAKQRMYDRFELLGKCKTALESPNLQGGTLTPEAQAADEAIDREWTMVTGRSPKDTPSTEVAAVVQNSPESTWLEFLAKVKIVLRGPRTPPLDDAIEQPARDALTRIESDLNKMGTPSPPSTFDRATQWFFIASLPFAPYCFWLFLKARRQKYRLDDEETLHFAGDPQTPDGAWTRQEIADIDMSRWMAKSIAWAVHTDGRRLKLDAFLHANLHLIIGVIASRFYPEQWDAEAKQIRTTPAGAVETSTAVAPANESASPD